MKTIILLLLTLTMDASALLFYDNYNLTVAPEIPEDRPVVEEYLPLVPVTVDNNSL